MAALENCVRGVGKLCLHAVGSIDSADARANDEHVEVCLIVSVACCVLFGGVAAHAARLFDELPVDSNADCRNVGLRKDSYGIFVNRDEEVEISSAIREVQYSITGNCRTTYVVPFGTLRQVPAYRDLLHPQPRTPSRWQLGCFTRI